MIKLFLIPILFLLLDFCNGAPHMSAKMIKIVPEIFGGNIPKNQTFIDKNKIPFYEVTVDQKSECIPGIYKKVTWPPYDPRPMTSPAPWPDMYRKDCCTYPTSAPPLYGHPQQNYGPVEAAIHSRHTYELREVSHNNNYPVGPPQIIEVPANYGSRLIHFKTAGSAICRALSLPCNISQYKRMPNE